MPVSTHSTQPAPSSCLNAFKGPGTLFSGIDARPHELRGWIAEQYSASCSHKRMSCDGNPCNHEAGHWQCLRVRWLMRKQAHAASFKTDNTSARCYNSYKCRSSHPCHIMIMQMHCILEIFDPGQALHKQSKLGFLNHEQYQQHHEACQDTGQAGNVALLDYGQRLRGQLVVSSC